MARALLLGCVFVLLNFVMGCAPAAPKPVPVSGVVDLDGQPMGEGTITLIGDQGAPPETLPVTAGKFEGKVTPGAKRVEIRAFKLGQETKMGDTVIPAPKVNYIAAEFNSESTLKAQVGAEGMTPSKFAVTSKTD